MTNESDWTEDLFGRALGDCPFADRSIGRQQQAMLDIAGSLPIEFGPGIVASETFVRWFLQMAQLSETSCHAATKVGPVDDEFGTVDTPGRTVRGDLVHYDLRFLKPGPGVQPVVVPAIDAATAHPQPGRMARPILSPRGPSFIWNVHHWPDLLTVNLLAVQARVSTIETAAGAAVTIHPTAVVENCELGDGVEIGPYAVVRHVVLGDRVRIEEHASVLGSVVGSETRVQTGALVHGSIVGPETVVSFHSAIRGSVLLGRSTISTPVVARSVIGEEVFLARAAALGATTIHDEPVRTRAGRSSQATGRYLLGCAIGNGSRIGNGVQLPPGAVVPSGVFLVGRPSPPPSPDLPKHVPLLAVDSGYRQVGFSSRRS